MTKLNFGCGPHYLKGYTNIDSQTTDEVRPDIEKDALEYLATLENDSVDEIYAGHFIEHLPLEKLDAFLNEVHRVLKPKCDFIVVVPDMLKGAICYESARIRPRDLDQIAFGARTSTADSHQSIWTRRRLQEVLMMYQFSIKDWLYRHPNMPALVDWQTCAVAQKNS